MHTKFIKRECNTKPSPTMDDFVYTNNNNQALSYFFIHEILKKMNKKKIGFGDFVYTKYKKEKRKERKEQN